MATANPNRITKWFDPWTKDARSGCAARVGIRASGLYVIQVSRPGEGHSLLSTEAGAVQFDEKKAAAARIDTWLKEQPARPVAAAKVQEPRPSLTRLQARQRVYHMGAALVAAQAASFTEGLDAPTAALVNDELARWQHFLTNYQRGGQAGGPLNTVESATDAALNA